MEFADLGSLVHLIEHSPLDEAVLSSLVLQLLHGLDYIHSLGVTHRDLKASNILLTSLGVVKLADFGIACPENNKSELDKNITGSAYWMAPEVIENIDTTSYFPPTCDIWSLGITIIELFEQRPPLFELKPLNCLYRIAEETYHPFFKFPEKISEELKSFVSTCLSRNPDERPAASFLLKHNFLKKPEAYTQLRNYCSNISTTLIRTPSNPSAKLLQQRKNTKAQQLTNKKDNVLVVYPSGRTLYILIEPKWTTADLKKEALKDVLLHYENCVLYYRAKGRTTSWILQEDEVISHLLRENEKHFEEHMSIRRKIEVAGVFQLFIKPCLPAINIMEELFSFLSKSESKPDEETTDGLIQLFNKRPLRLAHHLLRLIDLDSSLDSALFACLVQLNSFNNSLEDLIIETAEFELATLIDCNAILRGKSVSGNLISEYIKWTCSDWMKLVLAEPLPLLFSIKHSIELTKPKTAKSDLKKNVEIVGNLKDIIFKSFLSNLNCLPAEAKNLIVSLEILARNAGVPAYNVVKYILFDKLLIPALLSPENFGIVFEIPPAGQQTLTFITSVVSAVVSGKPITGHYLKLLNERIEFQNKEVDCLLAKSFESFQGESKITPYRRKIYNKTEICESFLNVLNSCQKQIRLQLGYNKKIK
ncbi:uncharacterized protein LOC135145865 [Zophobas morio]|uniref:uncharacterized protein LOC135145865 n=1 Tax=Zophobas morio TaxID=2755281 RepID=UPI00308292CE